MGVLHLQIWVIQEDVSNKYHKLVGFIEQNDKRDTYEREETFTYNNNNL
jgi:hypothetical protein